MKEPSVEQNQKLCSIPGHRNGQRRMYCPQHGMICEDCIPDHSNCQIEESPGVFKNVSFRPISALGEDVKKKLLEDLEQAKNQKKQTEEPIAKIQRGIKRIQEVIEMKRGFYSKFKASIEKIFDDYLKQEQEKGESLINDMNEQIKEREDKAKKDDECLQAIQKKIHEITQQLEDRNKYYWEIYEKYKAEIIEYRAELKRKAEEKKEEPSLKDILKAKAYIDPLTALLAKAEEFKHEEKEEFFKDSVEMLREKIFLRHVQKEGQSDEPKIIATTDFSSNIAMCHIPTMEMSSIDLVNSSKEYFKVPYNADVLEYQGRIYITGGTRDTNEHLKNVTRYSSLTMMLEEAFSEMITGRSEHGSVIGPDDSIIVAGGRNKEGYLNLCETSKIGIKTGRWTELAPLNEAKSFMSLCVFDSPEGNKGGV